MQPLPRHIYKAVRSLQATQAALERTRQIVDQKSESKTAKKVVENTIRRIKQTYQICKQSAKICLDKNDMEGAMQMARMAQHCIPSLEAYANLQAYREVVRCLQQRLPA